MLKGIRYQFLNLAQWKT